MAPSRTVIWLSACFALSASSISLNVATTPIVGGELAPSPTLATMPIALGILANMGASLPASLLMARVGRRRGFVIGTCIGILGAATAAAAVWIGSFWLFCLGIVGIGALNGFAQLYRFAAADNAPVDLRAQAISWVLAGGVVAGLLGPALSSYAKDALATAFVGSYVAAIGLYVGVLVILRRIELAPPSMDAGERPARPLAEIVRQPRFPAAVTLSMTGYGFMALIMTATPLSMQAAGHAFRDSAFVIQAHVVAMYAPSFVTGNLVRRLGSARMAAVGLACIAATIVVALGGQSVTRYVVALVLLGIGWNFLFVTGSTMLTTVHRVAERGKVQGINDLFVFGTAAAGSFAAAPLSRAGWIEMHSAIAPALILAAGALACVGWWVRSTSPRRRPA